MGIDFDVPHIAPEREANARLIAKAPELFDRVAGFSNFRDDGRCASCNAGIAPEGYCGCAESVSGSVEWQNIREARMLLLEVILSPLKP